MRPLAFALLLLTLAVVPADAACPPVHRSAAVVRQFRTTHPCPSTGQMRGSCPGFVVDHRWPLCAGGKDAVENMAWQDVQAAKDKDRLERAVCRLQPRPCPHQGD